MFVLYSFVHVFSIIILTCSKESKIHKLQQDTENNIAEIAYLQKKIREMEATVEEKEDFVTEKKSKNQGV